MNINYEESCYTSRIFAMLFVFSFPCAHSFFPFFVAYLTIMQSPTGCNGKPIHKFTVFSITSICSVIYWSLRNINEENLGTGHSLYIYIYMRGFFYMYPNHYSCSPDSSLSFWSFQNSAANASSKAIPGVVFRMVLSPPTRRCADVCNGLNWDGSL